MNYKLYVLLLLTAACCMVACDDDDNEVTTSSIAQLNTFYFAAQDSFPGFKEASFTVVQGTDTGLIYNEDSIQFGTPLHRAVPKYTFEATPASAMLQLGDTTIALSGSDTLDFTQSPIILTIISSDLTTTKVYRIEPTIHQVDPDLYRWEKLKDYIYSSDDSEQQVVILNNTFFLYHNNGYTTEVYRSTDATTWTKQNLQGLTASCQVKHIVASHNALYYAKDSTLYTSTDGILWTTEDYTQAPFVFHTMLMEYNDTVWAVVEDKSSHNLYLGKQVGDQFIMDMPLDNNFPISGFSAVEFLSSSYRRRAIVIGGYTREGACVNSRWNWEYSPTNAHPYRVINYTIEQPHFTTLTGIAVVWYNNQLLMFGGVDADMQYFGNEILISDDEGFTWYEADTAKCVLPDTYTARQKQSVVVKDNSIYVIGGQDGKATYSDVYRGKLNSIDWEDE